MQEQIRCRSNKNNSAGVYEEVLGRLDFPFYHSFENITDAHSYFI